MVSGGMLILGAIAIIVLFVGFGFLLGLLRGFRKSMFFTIIFIIVLILSFVCATVLAKNVYSGSALWKVAKKVIPDSVKQGSESVNSLKEFVRFYIVKNYNEVLDSGITAGESIVANENAMGIIDGLFIMIIKIFMLIGGYLVLNIAFYIVFGLIYVLFLRQKTYIETVTTTDEDGNETVEEREVKPKKHRLAGGLVGAGKGLIKSMVILIPITFLIGIVAQIDIPKSSSSVNAETRLASSNGNAGSFNDVVSACKEYDKSIGKIYLGLDDFVMDRIISYDVKGADGKKVTVVFRKEAEGFIDIYNTLESEIGIDNLKDYDFKANINSPEMKKVVKSFSDNLSKSNAVTTTLTAVGDEAVVILSSKLKKSDKDAEYIFTEVNLKGKNSEWWKTELAKIDGIYNSFTDMKLDLTKAQTKEYNEIFAETTPESYEAFVDTVFSSELIDMLVGGGLKYAVRKLPDDYNDVTETTDEVVENHLVNNEFKAFSSFIDIIKDDLKFNNGNIDDTSLTINTLNKIIETELLKNSKIVGKITESLLKNTIRNIAYDGSYISFDESIFARDDFSIHTELKGLVDILNDGFGPNYSLAQLKNLEGTSEVGQICDMLDSSGMRESMLANGIFSKLFPLVFTAITPTENYYDITSEEWKDEYPSISMLLSNVFGEHEKLSNVSNLNFDTLTYTKLSNLAASNVVWRGKSVNKLFNGLVIPFVEGIDIDGSPVTLDYDKEKIIWRNEIQGIVDVGIWANDTNEEQYENSVSSITTAFGDTIKVKVLDELGKAVQEEKKTELLHALANGALNSLFTHTGDSKDECPALSSVAYTLADSDGKFVLSSLGDLNEVKVSTIDTLESNTHKSIILMDKMAGILAEPLSTPNMVDEVDGEKVSAWDSAKWSREMPRIGEVLKTLASHPDDPDDAIIISEVNMGEDSEIKKITFERIEDNIAYSEALQNMFKNALSSMKDDENTIDEFPDPTSISGDETKSSWWEVEITGLLNVIYAEMYAKGTTTMKISEFNDTASGVKVAVVKALYNDAYYSREGVTPTIEDLRVKVIDGDFYQQSNIGVSEYLQYMFKPQLRDLSKSGSRTFTFISKYDWDSELQKIMNVFLVRNMVYSSETETIRELTDNEEVTISDEVNFKLLDASDCIGGAKEAMLKNKATLESIKDNIYNNTYLQFVLAPEMKKMMNEAYMAKDPTLGTGNETGWTNDEWKEETSHLFAVADKLITVESPKMEGIDFYSITAEQVEIICTETPKSYLLQSKMSQPLVNAGINDTSITTVSTLTGEKNLMQYIIDYEWNEGTNEAYEAVMDSLYAKRDGLMAMKDARYGIDGYDCTFYDENMNPLVTIYSTGEIKDASDNNYLTDDVTTKTNAVKTYAEYCLMVTALSESTDTFLQGLADNVADRGNTFIYSE